MWKHCSVLKSTIYITNSDACLKLSLLVSCHNKKLHFNVQSRIMHHLSEFITKHGRKEYIASNQIHNWTQKKRGGREETLSYYQDVMTRFWEIVFTSREALPLNGSILVTKPVSRKKSLYILSCSFSIKQQMSFMDHDYLNCAWLH